ncbi:hypothetical protein M1N22_02095 [Dehalococcoidia bacterium]|nr:hypothetical protein [Dehalococcoidia bacterium]MCL0050625.1 hypothetical protein [Dehalococcoidia bacterium]
MEKVYVFKVALKHRRGLWRRIEIKGNQRLADLDWLIRDAFNHDTFDHLSEFFKERWPRGGFGEIDPDGGGSGAKKRIEQLSLSEGDKIGYVYDFGDEILHNVTLEKIVQPEKGVEYPRVIAKNKPRYRYCERCQEQGKKTIAAWICIECSGEEGREVLLCEDCLEEEHEDHYADEILY